MDLQTAINRADWQAETTGRPHYVVGNGLGLYWTTDRLQPSPTTGQPQYAHYTARPPQLGATCAACGEAWPCTVAGTPGAYRADVVALHNPITTTPRS